MIGAAPRVLIASPVRQRPAILAEFLRGLAGLDDAGCALEFAFADDNVDPAASALLHAFDPGRPVRLLPVAPVDEEYVTDEETHHWVPGLMDRVAEIKDRMLRVAADEGFDAILLADSDLVLHPWTLRRLLEADVPICSEVFWTRWEPEGPELPQVWMHGQYSFVELTRFETIDDAEAGRRADAFVERMRVPGVHEVGGLGALTLIRTEAIRAGVAFRPIPHLQVVGEDRDFSVRAAALGIPLHAETSVPALHLYRDSDLERVAGFREAAEREVAAAWRKETGNRIVLSMVVRDEASGPLAQVLRHAASYVDAAVIVDDASTDDTVAVCRDALGDLPHQIVRLETSLFANEHELRRLQWEHTLAAEPDWVLSLDADELFEDGIRDIVRALVDQTSADAISFRLYDMWNDRQYRADEHWRAHESHRVLLVRPVPGMSHDWPEAAQHAGRFPPAVHELAQWTCTVRLKHLGWVSEERRRRKADRYRQLDPDARWGSAAQYASILDEAPTLVDF